MTVSLQRSGDEDFLTGDQVVITLGDRLGLNGSQVGSGIRLTERWERDEIRAIVHVIAIYCGVPQGLECFRVARKVLEEAGEI